MSACGGIKIKWFNETKFPASEYYRMPKLYKFDDYEDCMGTYQSEALYCVVNSIIKPDSSSELFNYIKDFSSNKMQHFRHDKLQRGMCVNKCRKLIHKIERDAKNYFVKKFPTDSKVSGDVKVVKYFLTPPSSLVYFWIFRLRQRARVSRDVQCWHQQMC